MHRKQIGSVETVLSHAKHGKKMLECAAANILSPVPRPSPPLVSDLLQYSCHLPYRPVIFNNLRGKQNFVVFPRRLSSFSSLGMDLQWNPA